MLAPPLAVSRVLISDPKATFFTPSTNMLFTDCYQYALFFNVQCRCSMTLARGGVVEQCTSCPPSVDKMVSLKKMEVLSQAPHYCTSIGDKISARRTLPSNLSPSTADGGRSTHSRARSGNCPARPRAAAIISARWTGEITNAA